VLTFFYSPHLEEAYASIQHLYRDFMALAWLRDIHRWTALFLLVSIILHLIRSLLRADFSKTKSKMRWLTGALLLPIMLAFLATGLILPWEWKGYWFMEMIPNYMESIPNIGASVKESLISAFTLNRAFVTHILILPVISLVLMDLHTLVILRKRKGGIPRYLLKHGLLTVPFFLVIVVLAVTIPMPTQGPEITPMPLEGTYVPTPEWFILAFFVPFMHYEGFMASFLSLYLPFIVFLLIALLPYYLRSKKGNHPETEAQAVPEAEEQTKDIGRRRKVLTFTSGIVVVFVSVTLFGSLYRTTYESPTLGCNSCHNIYLGARMGVPPAAFKDRNIVPNLDNDKWMVEHWFYPQVVW
jgi:quinol-cytochrome oxidoreductase complex cytochrome b subunit